MSADSLSQNRLAAVVDSLPAAVLVLDEEGRIAWENTGMRRLLGFPEGTVSPAMGRRILDLPNLQEPVTRSVLERLLRGEELRGVAVDFTSLGGQQLSVAVDAGPLMDGDVRRGSWMLLRDLAPGMPLAGRLMQVQRMEFMGVAVAGVIHDLNNILTALGGTLELLQDAEAEPDAELLPSLGNLLRRSRDITRRLLEASRPGGVGSAPLDLRTPVRQAADLMRHSFGRGLRVTASLPPEQVPVFGERAELLRALFNLGINSRDAMGGEGEIHLELQERLDPARCRARGWPGSAYAAIRVRDTGPGVPADQRDRIFEPFFSTKAVDRGTGMGLAVVHRVAISHGGEIELLDTAGGGACFELRLPLHLGRVADDRDTVIFRRMPADLRRPLADCRILVADDEPALRLMLADALRLRGAEVEGASTGSEALHAVRRAQAAGRPFDAALIDIHMPEVGGMEVLLEVQDLQPELRIVLTSGMDLGEDERQEIAERRVSFLPKPFELSEVVEALR